MNELDINGFYIVTSFLEPRDIKQLGICSKQNNEMCKYFMTYSYNEHGNDDEYVKMKNIKWIVDNCTENILKNILDKELNVIRMECVAEFNHSIEALSNCTQLKQLTFFWWFNQPIEALSNCIQLQQLTFGRDFNQPIEALSNCIQLHTLIFGHEFNQPIDALSNCIQLEELEFGYYFNQPVDALIKCKKLESLCCSDNVNFDILLNNLPGLNFEYCYDNSW